MIVKPGPSEEWLRMRKTFMRCMYMISVISGLKETIVYATEYLYIKNILRMPHAEFYFGLAVGMQQLSGTILAFIGTIIYDRTMRIRSMVLCSTMLCILGCVLYCLPYSIWLVISGNILLGGQRLKNCCVVAEMARIFEKNAFAKHIARIAIAYHIGAGLGPLVGIATGNLKIEAGSWSLTFGNAPIIILGGLYTLCAVVVWYYVYDVSHIYHFKEHEEEKEPNAQDNNIIINKDRHSEKMLLLDENKSSFRSWLRKYWQTIKKYILERHSAIILFSSATGVFSHFLIASFLVVEASMLLNWHQIEIAVLRIIMALSGAISAVAAQKVLKKVNDYLILQFGFVLTVLSLVCLAVLPKISQNLTAVEIVIYGNAAMWGIYEFLVAVASRTIIAKLVPASVQGAAEAVRFSLCQFGRSLGSFLVGFAVHDVYAFMASTIALNIAWFVILLFEYKFYRSNDFF